MTNGKRYFCSHLKSEMKSFVYILAVVLILTFVIGFYEQPTSIFDSESEQWINDYKSTLYIPVIFLCLLTYILPVMEFSFFKKRVNLDCAYSLPISRRAMGAVHYLTGLILLFGVFTLSYLLNFILLLQRGLEWFYFPPMITHYFLCLLLGFAMYSVMAFIFNEANTSDDGIWFIILYTFVFTIVSAVISIRLDVAPINAIPWWSIASITDYYQCLVELDFTSYSSFWRSSDSIFWLVFWIGAGIASAIFLLLKFGKQRTEKTEEISDSYFGFRTLIPIYAISGMIVFQSFISWVIIALFTVFGYTIYRRGFHYKKSDIIVFCTLFIFLFI